MYHHDHDHHHDNALNHYVSLKGLLKELRFSAINHTIAHVVVPRVLPPPAVYLFVRDAACLILSGFGVIMAHSDSSILMLKGVSVFTPLSHFS